MKTFCSVYRCLCLHRTYTIDCDGTHTRITYTYALNSE